MVLLLVIQIIAHLFLIGRIYQDTTKIYELLDLIVYIPIIAGLASFGKKPLATCIMANLACVFKYGLIVGFLIF